MKKIALLLVMTWSPVNAAFAQDPNCMWGEDDILCHSSRLSEKFKDPPSAGDNIRELTKGIRKSFSYQDPYSVDYDATEDECILNPNCDITAKGIAHYNWLYETCINGNNVACRKLQAGAHTPAPSFRYPNGERANVPYPPGYEPYRGDR